ncbi:MAG: hypothetical protein Q9N26_01200 [Aquificota bacterium]|nr:hypothetical protein [Aquificota bacterium]
MFWIVATLLITAGGLFAVPIEVDDAELDSVYAQGFFFMDHEVVSDIVNNLKDQVLQIALPEEVGDGSVIIAPSQTESPGNGQDMNVISLGEYAQQNAVNTVNSVESAVNQVLNIIIIINSTIGQANLNIENNLDAINMLF